MGNIGSSRERSQGSHRSVLFNSNWTGATVGCEGRMQPGAGHRESVIRVWRDTMGYTDIHHKILHVNIQRGHPISPLS